VYTHRLVHDVTVLTTELGRRQSQIRRLVGNGAATLSALGGESASIGSTIHELPATLDRVETSFAGVRSVLGDVDTALTDLQPVADRLGPALKALRDLSGAASPALEALVTPVTRLSPLARQLSPFARDLSRAVQLLAPQVGAIDHTTSDLAGCGFALQRFFQWTSSVFKLGDAHGPGPRADVTLGVESSGLKQDPRVYATPGCAPGRAVPGHHTVPVGAP
jgi:phospholipid/cholesterol/gamma-HCH transport system substrate-binding protein